MDIPTIADMQLHPLFRHGHRTLLCQPNDMECFALQILLRTGEIMHPHELKSHILNSFLPHHDAILHRQLRVLHPCRSEPLKHRQVVQNLFRRHCVNPCPVCYCYDELMNLRPLKYLAYCDNLFPIE